MSHYAVLGLQKGAGVEEIKKAYRNRIKECFNRLTHSYDALLNPCTDGVETSEEMFVGCVEAVVPLTLDEVYTGRIVSLLGRMVLIPPGCVDGSVLKAHAADNKTVYRITIKLMEYKGYAVRGYDLHTYLYISKRTIRRGQPIKIHDHPSWLTTLKPIQILLPKDTQQDDITGYSRLGLPCDNGAPGDLYIHTQVRSEWYFIKRFFRKTPNWVFAAIVVLIVSIFNLFI